MRAARIQDAASLRLISWPFRTFLSPAAASSHLTRRQQAIHHISTAPPSTCALPSYHPVTASPNKWSRAYTMANATVASAVEKDSLFIPLIDFSHFLNGTEAEKKTAANAILSGFQQAGFIYLKNHPIPTEVLSHVFASSAGFFARPQSQKDELAWYSPEANRGYVAHGREKVTNLEDKDDIEALRASVPDLKESLEIGRDDEAKFPNMWPDKFDEDGKQFRATMKDFFERCKNVHIELMRAVATGLGIEPAWFDEYTSAGDNTLRLLHYPSVDKKMFKREDGQLQVRAGEHSDYGSVTLLFQDDRGGLQVRSPQGTFVDATPIPGTIVINAGDLLARWSNDSIKSTNHRVIEPPPKPEQQSSDKHPARYSIAYFCNPNFDKFIDAIPGTYEETGKKYEGVNSGEYLIKRLTATY